MILKGRYRADGGQLADYLLSSKNEQVRVLDIRGTVIDDRSADGLRQSLLDMDELGKMTRAKSSLFHLAINPDDRDRMTPEDWKYCIDKAEAALGLSDQARAVVSHTYEGKEHLHVVWSRVDVEKCKCVEMSFSNLKLCSAAREIEIELGLKQTPARARGAHRLNQQIKDIQLQQDKRASQPRAERNAFIESAWHQSADGAEFKELIEREGFRLARGDRSVLVVDANDQGHSVARCVKGIKVKDVRAKLGELEKELPHIDELRKAKTQQTETDSGTTEPMRRQAQQLTERGAQDMGLKEKPRAPELAERKAKDLQAVELAEMFKPANDNVKPEDQAQQKKPERAAQMMQMPWETAEEFEKRQQAAREREQQQKLQLDLKPKGPQRSY